MIRLSDKSTIPLAITMTLAIAGPALAQDVLGAAQVATEVMTFFRIVAMAFVAWGFFRLMVGRHHVEALFCMAVGGLGLAKTAAVAALLGF